MVINEVMANPIGKETTSGDRNEWIELYNPTDDTVDVGKWIIDDLDAKDEILPWQDSALLDVHPDVLINTTKIPPKGYALIMDPEYLNSDPEGKYEHPYNIPPNTVILTIDDTSIGNGLSTTDPLLLISPDTKDTVSTFGTPFIEDEFPYDPGDGISLERLEPLSKDTPMYWVPCIAPEGSTPGRENSPLFYIDGSVDSINMLPPWGKAGEETAIEVWISNHSFREIECCLSIFVNQELYGQRSINLYSRETKRIDFSWTPSLPQDYKISALLEINEDENSANDTLSITYQVRTEGLVTIYPVIYTGESPIEINYSLPDDEGYLSIKIFDAKGRVVDKVLEHKRVKGGGVITYTPIEGLKNGIYLILYRFKKQNYIYEKKVPFYIFKKNK